MKVDYRVRLKETGHEGQAVEEFGPAGETKVRVYWGTTSDGAVQASLRHYKVHDLNDLDRVPDREEAQ